MIIIAVVVHVLHCCLQITHVHSHYVADLTFLFGDVLVAIAAVVS